MKKTKLILGVAACVVVTSLVACTGKAPDKKAEGETTAAETTAAETTLVEETTTAAITKEDKCIWAESGKKYSIDFNGDGKEESLVVNITGKEWERVYSIELNGKEVMSFEDNHENMDVEIVDMNTQDSEKELVVFDNGPSVDPTTRIYRLVGDKFEEAQIAKNAYYVFYDMNTVYRYTRTDEEFGTGYYLVVPYTYEDGTFSFKEEEGAKLLKFHGDTVHYFMVHKKSYDEPYVTTDENARDMSTIPYYAYKDLQIYEQNGKEMKKAGTIAKYTELTIGNLIMSDNAVDKYPSVEYAFAKTADSEGWIDFRNVGSKSAHTMTEEEWNSPELKDLKDKYEEVYNSLFTNGLIYPINLAD